jgi:beta-N-acetylhexosaminidase
MRRHVLLVVTTALAAAFGVSSSAAVHSPSLSSYSAPSRPATSPKALAAAAYARLGPKQRIGQLFMTGVASSGPSSATVATLRRSMVGNVILTGNSSAGRAADKRITSSLATALTYRRVGAFISTDQEGGEVQRLTGHGFSTMPTALAQGKLAPATLQADAKTWGHQLVAAGINLNLAPVADTVPAAHAHSNAPIGASDRELGHTPSAVAAHVVPLVRGMAAAGLDTTVKHFPGLGRATGNTDLTPGVTDPTTRHSSYVQPFQAGVTAGTALVMVSSAKYPNIDPHHIAPFSKIIIGSMLRGDLGFHGVVISDDLGTVALKRFSFAQRATDFFHAGGTILLDTTPSQVSTMVAAVTAKAAASSSFAALLKSAEMTVLLAKARAGLIAA